MHTHTLSMANFAFQVQSEVVRLSERLEKMERIALERQEKERERERARERSERERQLSARVRQLEGPSICRDVNGLAWLRRPAPRSSAVHAHAYVLAFVLSMDLQRRHAPSCHHSCHCTRPSADAPPQTLRFVSVTGSRRREGEGSGAGERQRARGGSKSGGDTETC